MWTQHLEFIKFFTDILCLANSGGKANQTLLSACSYIWLPLCFLLDKLLFFPLKRGEPRGYFLGYCFLLF